MPTSYLQLMIFITSLNTARAVADNIARHLYDEVDLRYAGNIFLNPHYGNSMDLRWK
jgi:hypothetical protein